MSEPLPDWPDQPTAPVYIGVEELTAYLKGLGVPDTAPKCFDDPYDPISIYWVSGTMAGEWKSLCNKLNLKPRSESSDCDDFASGCRWYAQVVHNREGAENAACVAEVAYDMIGYGEHDVVAAIDRNPDRSLSVAFFEPEPTAILGGFVIEVLKPITLTPDEIKTITDFRL